jgi:AcrR family transcriptional regulator
MARIVDAVQKRADPRERILAASYDLFSRRGIRDVGVNELIASSGVARASFYQHFASKEDLIIAFLERREQVWMWGLVVAGAQQRASAPRDQLLAIFDVFDEWFAREDFEGCSFMNVLLELGPGHPAGRACIEYGRKIRVFLLGLATTAELAEPQEFAHSFHLLMKGSIIAAVEGDRRAAQRAHAMARRLIEHHRR